MREIGKGETGSHKGRNIKPESGTATALTRGRRKLDSQDYAAELSVRSESVAAPTRDEGRENLTLVLESMKNVRQDAAAVPARGGVTVARPVLGIASRCHGHFFTFL